MAENNNNNINLSVDRSPLIAGRINQIGVSGLLSRTYNDGESAASKFYDGDDFGLSIGNQIPVIYGTVQLAGQVLDSGRVRSDLDPTRIKRVYRFMMAEGPVAGIGGVGQDKLQNVIVDCQRVVTKEGKPVKNDVGLKEILGGLAGAGMMAAPFIAELFDEDDEGNPIESTIPEVLDAAELLGGDPVKGTEAEFSECHVVVPDANTGKLTTKPIYEVLQNGVKINVVGGEGGKGGDGGDGGKGGDCGCDGETPTPTPTPEEECTPDCTLPATGFATSETHTPPPGREIGGLALLKHNGSDRYYHQPFDMTGKGELRVHIFMNGLFLETTKTFQVIPSEPVRDCSSPSTTPDPAESESYTCQTKGKVTITWCLLNTAGKLLAEGTQDFSEQNDFAFSRVIKIPLSEALAANDPEPCDPLSSVSENIVLRIYRDEGTSSSDVYFQGLSWTEDASRVAGPEFVEELTPGEVPEACPTTNTIVLDDELFPVAAPSGSYKTTACPAPTTDTGTGGTGGGTGDGTGSTGEAGSPGQPGEPGKAGTASFENLCEEPDPLDPTLEATKPRDTTYDPDTPAKLPKLTATTHASDTDVTVEIKLEAGEGVIYPVASNPPANYVWEAETKTLRLTGPVDAVNGLLENLYYTPSSTDTGTIYYSGKITDADGKDGKIDGRLRVIESKIEPLPEETSDFWGRLGDFALNILPSIGAGLLANTIYSSIGQTEIRLPDELVKDDSKIAVVYSGLIVDVPSNYDAATRTYSGEWDYSSFQQVFTTNPAWCLLDFMKSKRYGAGNALKLTEAQWTQVYKDLYAAAQRCDEMVADGRGGTGPRYTLNTAIAGMTRLEVIDAIAGAMHAQVIYGPEGVRVMQDRPSTPVMVVTNANVTFDKGFSYSGGSLDASYNWVEVAWNNPDKFYKLETTYVADPNLILVEGERKHSVAAFGCCDEAMAKRHAAWVMVNEQANPLVVSYSAGFDHDGLIPGDIVILNDNTSDAGLGGRILEQMSGTQYRADREGQNGFVHVMDRFGNRHSVGVTWSGDVMTLTEAVDLPVGSIWVVTSDAEAKKNQWKILSITEQDNGLFAVTAVKHNPDKYGVIDNFFTI